MRGSRLVLPQRRSHVNDYPRLPGFADEFSYFLTWCPGAGAPGPAWVSPRHPVTILMLPVAAEPERPPSFRERLDRFLRACRDGLLCQVEKGTQHPPRLSLASPAYRFEFAYINTGYARPPATLPVDQGHCLCICRNKAGVPHDGYRQLPKLSQEPCLSRREFWAPVRWHRVDDARHRHVLRFYGFPIMEHILLGI